jgi:hypothetical protein
MKTLFLYLGLIVISLTSLLVLVPMVINGASPENPASNSAVMLALFPFLFSMLIAITYPFYLIKKDKLKAMIREQEGEIDDQLLLDVEKSNPIYIMLNPLEKIISHGKTKQKDSEDKKLGL